jgi:hypothetical protein
VSPSRIVLGSTVASVRAEDLMRSPPSSSKATLVCKMEKNIINLKKMTSGCQV